MTSRSKTVVIIQARMGSTRLPGKSLTDIHGVPMLGWVIDRSQRAEMVDEVLVATTTSDADDAICDYCTGRNAPIFRGSESDVLDRYCQAARRESASHIVRITGDCPLIDPALIDLAVRELLQGEYDFVANRLPPPWTRTYPMGLDVEVCTAAALEMAWQKAEEPFEREHVMPYLYTEPGRFRIHILECEQGFGHLRFSVDTAEDLALVRKIFERFEGRDDFGWREIASLLQREPHLQQLNAGVKQKLVDE